MLPITLMLIYSFIITIISIFLFNRETSYKKKYKQLLKYPNKPQRVQIFFNKIKPVLEEIYKEFDPLYCKRGRKPTNYCFQFRWLLWWKFFGSPVLSTALKEFNENSNLHEILRAPAKIYTREIFHGFRKKLEECNFEKIQTILLKEIDKLHKMDWNTLVIDSFPIESYLNTTKCLKPPKRDYHDIKEFIDNLNLSSLLDKLNISVKKRPSFETKLIALLVKNIWDFSSWNQCWKELYGKKAIKARLSLPKVYKTCNSLMDIEKYLNCCKKSLEIKEELVVLATSILQKSKFKKKNFKPKNLEELVLFIHTPHRFKDPGISLSYCAAKNNYFYGRGGIIAALTDIELPIMVYLSSKYKQCEQSIIEFINKLNNNFEEKIKNIKWLQIVSLEQKSVFNHLKN